MIDYGVDLICCPEEGKQEQLSMIHLSEEEANRLIRKYHDKAYDQNVQMFQYVLWMCKDGIANKIIDHRCYPNKIM